jgi:hypothetical protein
MLPCSGSKSASSSSGCVLQRATVDSNSKLPYLSVQLVESNESQSPQLTSSAIRSNVLDWTGLVQYIHTLVGMDTTQEQVSQQQSQDRGGVFHLLIDDLDCLQYIAPSYEAAAQLLSTCFRCHNQTQQQASTMSNIVLFGRNPVMAKSSASSSNRAVETDLIAVIGERQEAELAPTLTEYCKYRYGPYSSCVLSVGLCVLYAFIVWLMNVCRLIIGCALVWLSGPM